MNSILTSIKKLLGISEEYEHFDTDVMIHINSAIMTLTQLGVGPKDGYKITSSTDEWSDFLTERVDIESVKTFVYLKVRLTFDPPTNAFLVNAIEDQIKELTWRIRTLMEGEELV